MAIGNMKNSRQAVDNAAEILFNSAYVGRALTLDTAAFTEGVCKAGTPINAAGKKATTTAAGSDSPASSDAVGILLYDVSDDRPQATLVIGGYINLSRAQAHSGVTYDAATKDALKNVVFC